MAEDNIKVAVVDDDGEIRQLLTVIIDGSPGYSCRQSYNDCESAVDGILNDPPDVVLMDINLVELMTTAAVIEMHVARNHL